MAYNQMMRQQWIFSAVVDCSLILAGFSLCVLLSVFHPFALDVRIAILLFACDRFLASAHSWSTTYMVMGSKIFSSLRRQSPNRFFWIPILIFLFSLIVGVFVAKVVNISDSGEVDWQSFIYYVPFIGFFWVGHFWHFGRQDFGVLSLYRKRCHQSNAKDRLIDERFTQVMMYVIQPIVYFRAFSRSPFTVLIHDLTGVQAIIDPLAIFACTVAVVMFLCIFIFELSKPNRSFGKLLYYFVILFHPLFLYFSTTILFYYWHLAYLWSHWLIAIALTARVNVGYNLKTGMSLRRALLSHAAIIGLIVIVVGIYVEPFKEMSLLSKDFIDAREIIRLLPPSTYTLVGLFFGFTLGEQLVHYYCDRCLFRFKDERVRATIGPLL